MKEKKELSMKEKLAFAILSKPKKRVKPKCNCGPFVFGECIKCGKKLK